MLETKQRENLAQMKTTLKEMKSSNQKIFAGAHPNCDENDWTNGVCKMICIEDYRKRETYRKIP